MTPLLPERVRTHLEPIRTRLPPGARRFTTRVDGHEIHAVRMGSHGEPLLLLHGLSGSARWWRHNLAGLARTHRVLVPDLIGFGDSALGLRVPSPEGLSDALAVWLDRLDCDRVRLVGHSMGGQISLHLSTRHPERVEQLVLVDAAGLPRSLSPRELIRFGMDVAPLWRWGDPTFLPTIASDALRSGPLRLAQAIGHILRDDVRSLLPRVQARTLIVWGELDTLVPLSDGWRMRQQIPESELAVLRGAGHNPMVDRPADFNRLVLRFLEGESVGR